jgi:hypothetical protein
MIVEDSACLTCQIIRDHGTCWAELMQRRMISVNYLTIYPLGGEMSDSGWRHLPAGAVVPGADGCAYLVPDGAQAAFRVTGGQARGPAGPPFSETFTVPGGIPADKRIRESLAHLPQMPVVSC